MLGSGFTHGNKPAHPVGNPWIFYAHTAPGPLPGLYPLTHRGSPVRPDGGGIPGPGSRSPGLHPGRQLRAVDPPVTRGGRAGRTSDRLHHDRRVGHAQTRAAVLGRHRDAEPAAFGNGLIKVERETAFLVLLQPIGVV